MFDLSDTTNGQTQDTIFATILNVPNAMFARSLSRSLDCNVEISYDEKALYNSASDRVSITVNDYYRSNLEGLCGNFDEDRLNDGEFCDGPGNTAPRRCIEVEPPF